MDYGFNIFIGFGFGFGLINSLKSESESDDHYSAVAADGYLRPVAQTTTLSTRTLAQLPGLQAPRWGVNNVTGLDF